MISPLVPKNPLRSELIIHTDWTNPNQTKRKPHPPKRPKTCPGPDKNFKLIHSHKLQCRTKNQTSKHSFKRRVESSKARILGKKKKKNRTQNRPLSILCPRKRTLSAELSCSFPSRTSPSSRTRGKRTKFGIPSSGPPLKKDLLPSYGVEEVIMFGYRSSLSAAASPIVEARKEKYFLPD